MIRFTSREEDMSWLRRLLQPFTKPTEIQDHSRTWPGLQAMPTVKFDPSTVSKSVKANLRRNIELLNNLEKKHVQQIYEVALRSILVGFDRQMLHTALLKIEGIPKDRAVEIARSLHKKARVQIDRERMLSLGITHAIWMYPNAPCMKDPFSSCPTAEDVQQDSAHRAANGKKYEIDKGLFVNSKWTWPGVEDGCKCAARAVLPWSGD
jgi:hypothetical protein